MMQLEKDVAINVLIFMADATDNITGKTGLTLTINASKAGAALSAITPTVTERTLGYYQLALTTAHTDTLGQLELYITGTNATPSTVTYQVGIEYNIWDETLTGSNHNIANSAGKRLRQLQTSGNYEGGQVWIDTVNGTAGSTLDTNGVSGLPVSNIADAILIAVAGGFKKFYVANGSSITFAANMSSYNLVGQNYTIALGGQIITGAYIEGANVSGTGTGTAPFFKDCHFGIASLPAGVFQGCTLAGAASGGFTCSGTGTYLFHDCRDTAIVSTFPIITLFAGACGVIMNTYAGYIKFAGMTNASARVEVSGQGNIAFDSGNTNGSALITGNWDVLNSGAGLTKVETANFNVTQAVGSVTGAVGSVTGAVGSVTGNVGGNVVGSVASVANLTVALIWAQVIETGFTATQSMRLMLSALAAKLSGAATTTVTIRDIGDTKARITATVDADGNRTAITTDVT